LQVECCQLVNKITQNRLTTINFNEKEKKVWKVETTDDISNNSATNTYYLEKSSRKILKQEINFGSRKMLIDLAE